MKTPEEIKKGLECLTKKCEGIVCRECELYVPGYEVDTNTKDALAYIQQLERERDAAVEQLKEVDRLELFCCSHCKHEELDEDCFLCTTCIHMSNWEWIGA